MMLVFIGTLARTIAVWVARLLRLWNAEQPLFVFVDTDDRATIGNDVPPSGLDEVDFHMPNAMEVFVGLPSLDDTIAAIDRGDLVGLRPYRQALKAGQIEEEAGARNLPAVGAASAIFHKTKIRRSLTTALRRIANEAQSRQVLIVLVRTETGGTGAGATPVIARILREVAEANGIPVTVWLLSVGSPLLAGGSEERARANAYATRKELQAYGDLCDVVFEIGDTSPGSVALEPWQVLGQVAHFLAHLCASGLGDFLLQRLPDEAVDFCRPNLVWTFGLATLYTPIKEGQCWVASFATAVVIERILNGDGEPQPDDLMGFCSSIGIDPDPERLVRELQQTEQGSSVREQVMSVVESVSNNDAWVQILFNLDTKSAELSNACAKVFEANAQRLARSLAERLKTQLPNFCRRFGLRGAVQAIEAAFSHLEGFRQRVMSETPPSDLFPPHAIARELNEIDGELLDLVAQIRHLQQRRFSFFHRRRLALLAERGANLFGRKMELTYAQCLCETFVRLIDQLSTLLDDTLRRLQKLIADLEGLHQQSRGIGEQLFHHAFAFQVPVGICAIRPPICDDPLWFVQHFWNDNKTDAVLADFWTVHPDFPLTELLLDALGNFVRSRLINPSEGVFSLNESAKGVLQLLVRKSRELLVLDEAIAREAPHLRFVIAPSALHDTLRSLLRELNEPMGGADGWRFIESGGAGVVAFCQLRIGVPITALKQNREDFKAYLTQSKADGTELRHSRPVWRYLPEIVPGVVWEEATALWEELAQLLGDGGGAPSDPAQTVELLRRFDELATNGQTLMDSLPPHLLQLARRYQGGK